MTSYRWVFRRSKVYLSRQLLPVQADDDTWQSRQLERSVLVEILVHILGLTRFGDFWLLLAENTHLLRKGSITVWMTSCLTGLDLTKQAKLMLIQHKPSSLSQTKLAWGQPYSVTSAKVSILWLEIGRTKKPSGSWIGKSGSDLPTFHSSQYMELFSRRTWRLY